MKAVCAKTPLAAARKADPAGRALSRELGLTSGNCHIVILDAQGDLLDCCMAEAAGSGCTKASAGEFPAKFAARIEEGLKRTDSTGSLERAWKAMPSDPNGFEALAARLRAWAPMASC